MTRRSAAFIVLLLAVKILADGRFAFGAPAGEGERPWSGGGTFTANGETFVIDEVWRRLRVPRD